MGKPRGPLQGQGLRKTNLFPKMHGVPPEIKVGDRVSASTKRGREMATVLLKHGFRLRIRTDSGYEFSTDLNSVWLMRERESRELNAPSALPAT